MRFSRKLAKRGLVFAAFGLLALLGGEFATRVHVQGSVSGGFRSLFTNAPGAVSNLPHAPLVADPELGYVLNPDSPGVNALGFKGPEPEEWSKLEGEIQLIVGDSVAFDEDGFASLLPGLVAEKGGKRVAVLNCSVPGYTTFQERLILSRLEGVRPKNVILQYCMNDNHEFLHRITKDGTKLLTPEAKRVLLPDGKGVVQRLMRWSYLAVEIGRIRLRRRAANAKAKFPWADREDFCTAWRAESWPRQEREIAEINRLVKSWGGTLYVLVIPIASQLDDRLLRADREYVLFPQDQLRGICDRQGIARIDLFEAFLSESRLLEPLFRDDLHLTATGHQLVARKLLETLYP